MNDIIEPVDSIARALEVCAARYPSRPAVHDLESVMSYAQLHETATAMAQQLRARGIEPGDRVLLSAAKSGRALSALYAIMRAGAVCVPVDPSCPWARVRHVAESCEPVAAIVDSARKRRWEHSSAPPTIDLETLDARPGDEPLPPVDGDDLAYILYTSGSTGTPKGIAHRHRSALSFATWAAREFQVGPEDRLANHAPWHFDLSTFDLYASVLTGACVHLIPGPIAKFPHELVSILNEHRITVWYSVPFALELMRTKGGLTERRPPHLRLVLFAGEAFDPPRLAELHRTLPDVGLCNLYGPTETNVVTYHWVDGSDFARDSIPIGLPCPGTVVDIRGDDGRQAGSGQSGELHVRGPTLMHGYFNAPALDRAAFRIDDEGRRSYRTGDRVRRSPDGTLHFLGRRDRQVKVRGYRIELEEIETAMRRDLPISEAVVVVDPGPPADRLVAFVIIDGELPAPEGLRWRQRLARVLPNYAVPERFEIVEHMPRNANGKTDTAALRARLA